MTATVGPQRARFDHVSLIFDTPKGKLSVVEDVSYDINDGDFIAVIGPSGCGKTTMMSMLAGFQKPTKGEVLFDGRPVKGPGPERGVIFQEYGVFPWLTVKENIAFGLQLKANHVALPERDRICEHYLTLMGLADFVNSYPKHLSGGMRQRLAIARAYAVRPQFLLMDEPFSALDMQTRTLMQDELLQLWSANAGCVVFVTHDLEEAVALADRVFVLSARPATLKRVYEIDLPRPRVTSEIRYEARFIELSKSIWHDLREEVTIS